MGGISGEIGNLASFIGSLTVVGSALLWIYNKFIGQPRERKREEDETQRHSRMIEVVTKENRPLNESIKQLTDWLHESKIDRKSLNKISQENTIEIDNHDKRLDIHHGRLIRLETKNNILYKGGE